MQDYRHQGKESISCRHQFSLWKKRKNENKPFQECHVIAIRTQIKKKIWNITLKHLTYGTFHPVCSHRVQVGSTSAVSLNELFTHLWPKMCKSIQWMLSPREKDRNHLCRKARKVQTRRRAKKKENADNDLKIGTNNSKWKKHSSRDKPCGHSTLLCSCSGLLSKSELRK